MLYYAAKTYSHQLKKGEQYHELKPVIFLGILNFNFTADPHYLSTHCIHNVFIFAELPKFKKTESELQTVEDKWLFFLKNAKQLTAIPETIREAAIREAFEIVNSLHWDKETLDLYTMRNIHVQIETNRVVFGYNKGLTEGETKGQVKSQYIIAHTMLTKAMPLETVAECTGLSLNEVKTLSEQLKELE